MATLAGIWEFFRGSSNTRRVRDPAATSVTAIIFIGVFALISLVTLYFFRRMLRRAGTSDGHTPYQLSGSAWKAMLWCAFAVGVGFGIAMIVSMQS